MIFRAGMPVGLVFDCNRIDAAAGDFTNWHYIQI